MLKLMKDLVALSRGSPVIYQIAFPELSNLFKKMDPVHRDASTLYIVTFREPLPYQCNYQEVSHLIPYHLTYLEVQLKIKQLVDKIQTDRTEAIKYLSKQNWDVEAASASFTKNQFSEFQNSMLNSHEGKRSPQERQCLLSEYDMDMDDMNYDEEDDDDTNEDNMEEEAEEET